ncbi:DinB family protein [Bacillus sp. FJAT-49732]|uniref:DinB family protein n=1 Tax=Lederbergia citrisecunda TaxID=2833583 RepID=A0A942TU27_9BACI|nr:DinB family protein [Lederbergia citrisecunda]MBS4201764.1 DinB family protein [Lederbergia citrisecunda]
MQNVIDKLNDWLVKVSEGFSRFTESEISERPLPHKWSKKEILGHLCDSAINNLERFIRIQYQAEPLVLIPYNQDKWVELQGYREMPIEEVMILWSSLNKKIINVISKIPRDQLMLQCNIGNNQLRTLEWLIKDYLDHMEHHLNNQIFK